MCWGAAAGLLVLASTRRFGTPEPAYMTIRLLLVARWFYQHWRFVGRRLRLRRDAFNWRFLVKSACVFAGTTALLYASSVYLGTQVPGYLVLEILVEACGVGPQAASSAGQSALPAPKAVGREECSPPPGSQSPSAPSFSAASAPSSPFASAAGGDGAAGGLEGAEGADPMDQERDAAFGDRSYSGGAGVLFDKPASGISAQPVSIGGDQKERGKKRQGRRLESFKPLSARVIASVFSIEQPEAAAEQQPEPAPQQQPGPAPASQPQPALARRLQLSSESLVATAAMLQIGQEAGMSTLPSASRLNVASSIDVAGRVVQFCSSQQPAHWTAALDGVEKLVDSIGHHVKEGPHVDLLDNAVDDTRLRRLYVAALVVASKHSQVQAPGKIGLPLTNRGGAQREYGRLLAPVKPFVDEILASLTIPPIDERFNELWKAGTLIRQRPLICSAGSLHEYSPKQLLAALADLLDHSLSPANLETAMEDIKAEVAAAGIKHKTRFVFQEHVFERA
eukprot:tig00001535_g9287.t1